MSGLQDMIYMKKILFFSLFPQSTPKIHAKVLRTSTRKGKPEGIGTSKGRKIGDKPTTYLTKLTATEAYTLICPRYV